MALFSDSVQGDAQGGGVAADIHVLTTQAEAGLSAESNLGALTTGLLKHTVAGGVSTPATADPALDYVSPAKTADTASATTVTLPETGLLAPITGSTQIDFLTKPTGDAPRFVILWFKATITVRESVAGAGAGTTNINLLPNGTANTVHTFLANSLLPLFFDGAQWRKAFTSPHWDGSAVRGNSATAAVDLNGSTGARLQFGAAQSMLFDSTGGTLTATRAVMSARPKLTKASVASASNVTLTAGCPLIEITGTTQVNTFTSTGWEDGMRVAIRFTGALTLKHNSGGSNDFMLRGGGDVTTAAGMVLDFIFDGTDMVEVGHA